MCPIPSWNTIETFDRMLTVASAARINAAIAAARRINRGLNAISQALRDEPENRKLELLKLAGFSRSDGTPLQLVTIHRYHPREELGSLLGLLNFETRHIKMLIEKGLDDAVHHDCAKSECVLAEEPTRPPQ